MNPTPDHTDPQPETTPPPTDITPVLDFYNREQAAKLIYIDPCHVIPDHLWSEYCYVSGLATFTWQPFTFYGITFERKRTGGDGVFYGVDVDSGEIARMTSETKERLAALCVEPQPGTLTP